MYMYIQINILSVIQYKLVYVYNKFKKYIVVFMLPEYIFCVISVDYFLEISHKVNEQLMFNLKHLKEKI